MNQKGFTLIELLAVTVILAFVALITTPIVLNIVENERLGAAKSSTYAYIEAAEKAAIIYFMNNSQAKLNGDCTVESKDEKPFLKCPALADLQLDIKGNLPTSGTVSFGSNGRVTKASLLKFRSYTIDYAEIQGAYQHKD